MRKLLLSLLFLPIVFFSFAPISDAAVHVNGYYRSNGTYVAPHYRSNPDSSVTNNWSYKGNVNPYTGKVGTNTYGGVTSKPSAITALVQKPVIQDDPPIVKSILGEKSHYLENSAGFRERLIQTLSKVYPNQSIDQVITQVYRLLPDIK